MQACAAATHFGATGFNCWETEELFFSVSAQFVCTCRATYHDIRHGALLALRKNPHAHIQAQFIATEYLPIAMHIDFTRHRRIVGIGKRFGPRDMKSASLKGCSGILFQQPASVSQRRNDLG
ncbi:hypothetical protein AA310_00810 [Arthrobacter sp. YC-RL1]|nr:hypothetical protein ATC04_18145 [Arthrobacter sp. YC-RL1]KLI90509.1 hypothetical protein AA310_00810 [Arthrobacter sp. YC-RL1]